MVALNAILYTQAKETQLTISGKAITHHQEYTSVDAKHHGASLSKQWNVTWVGNNSVCIH